MENLPDFNVEKKKEEKKGFLASLRRRLGFGGPAAESGQISGTAGFGRAASGASNLGRAATGFGKIGAGAGSFGSGAAGAGGLLAGKAGIIVAGMVVAAAIGTTLYMENKDSNAAAKADFNSAQTQQQQENYIPAIDRKRQQASSLDLLRESNSKGNISMDEVDPAKQAADKAAQEAAAAALAAEMAGKNAEQAQAEAPAQNNMAQQMIGKMASGNFSLKELSTSMGTGSSKMSAMGGFGNKFNTGATGGGTTAGFGKVGAGFQVAPRFDQRGKLLAMKNNSRPVFSNGAGSKKGAVAGKGAYSQAKFVNGTQKTFSGTEIDGAKSTQDLAWVGSTGSGAGGTGMTPSGGTPTGGAGTGSGGGGSGGSGGNGGGVATSPSIDNFSNPIDTDKLKDVSIPNVTGKLDISPWKALLKKAMMLVMLSAAIAAIGATLITIGTAMILSLVLAPLGFALVGIGMILCMIAAALAAMAIMIGMMVMAMGQVLLGTLYMLGGGLAAAGAITAMTGNIASPIIPAWLLAGAGIMGLIGSMAGGK